MTGLWARNCAIITVILKFAFGPENFPGLSRNGPQGEKENRRAKRAESGLGKKKGESVDFVLTPPIHDTRFWCHDLIVQIDHCDK